MLVSIGKGCRRFNLVIYLHLRNRGLERLEYKEYKEYRYPHAHKHTSACSLSFIHTHIPTRVNNLILL